MSPRTGSRIGLRAAGALIAAVLVLTGCSSEAERPAEPDRLPSVTLDSLGGGPPLELSSLRGPAVVNLWASWCAPCRRELPLYQAFAQKYAGKVQVIGIDFQDTREDEARQLVRDTGVTYPLYRDPDGLMRARGLPQLILVDEQGEKAYEEYVEIVSLDQLEKLVAEHLDAA